MCYFRINIPTTIRLHLTEYGIEYLTRIAIRRKVTASDVESLYTALYPTRRRTVRALIKQVDESDIELFNVNTEALRDDNEYGDRYSFVVCSNRTVINVTKIGQ